MKNLLKFSYRCCSDNDCLFNQYFFINLNFVFFFSRHWLFEEFLSHDECINLIKVHKEHVKKMQEIDPIICFDSIQTLRKHLKELKPNTEFSVTPNDFTKG